MNNTLFAKTFIVISIATVTTLFSLLTWKYDYFTIENIEIKGNDRVSANEIIKRADIVQGLSKIFFNSESAKSEILKNLWIKNVSIIKKYPDKVIIEIQENDPFCILAKGKMGYFYLSDGGRILGKTNKKEGMDFPIISMEKEDDHNFISDATALLKLSQKSDVLNWKEISEIEISNNLGIRIITNDQRYIDFGNDNIIFKWYRVERIINKARSKDLTEKYINISSDKLGIIDFRI